MKALFILFLVTISVQTLATEMPLNIETNNLEIESLSGVMEYTPITGDCSPLVRRYFGVKKSENKITMKFGRTLWPTIMNRCGLYKFTGGEFELKLKGQTAIPFKIQKGKLINNYNSSWGHVLWGSWVNGSCTFRDGIYRSCDAGSDSTRRNAQRLFTLFISPLYTSFDWNIYEELR